MERARGNEEIGERIKELRSRHGLSMRKLAKLAGITVSNVSNLEAGRISPTLATLRKLLSVLHTDLGEFLAVTGDKEHNLIFRGSTMRVVADEMRRYKFILPRRLDIHVEMLDEVFMPGEKPEFETLSSDLDAYVIEGEMVIEIQDEEVTILAAGDAFHVPSGRPVRGYCAGETPVRLVTVYHPPRY